MLQVWVYGRSWPRSKSGCIIGLGLLQVQEFCSSVLAASLYMWNILKVWVCCKSESVQLGVFRKFVSVANLDLPPLDTITSPPEEVAYIDRETLGEDRLSNLSALLGRQDLIPTIFSP